MSCPSSVCDDLRSEGSFCAPINDNVCHYKITYLDQSHTLGDFAFEILTLGSTPAPGSSVQVQNTLIGRSYNTLFPNPSTSFDIIGLGRGPASLIMQLDSFIDWRFSYCLSRSDRESTIDFSRNVMGDGVVSTPLINDPSFFLLRLEAMSVGNVRIPFRGSAGGDQTITIDFDTVYTTLPTKFFSKLSPKVARQIVGRKRVGSPLFNLCYEAGPTTSPINALPIIMNFLGADVVLPLSNVFIQIGNTGDVFFFLPTDDDISIYDNLAQINFLINYELQNTVLSFKPL